LQNRKTQASTPSSPEQGATVPAPPGQAQAVPAIVCGAPRPSPLAPRPSAGAPVITSLGALRPHAGMRCARLTLVACGVAVALVSACGKRSVEVTGTGGGAPG